MLSATGARQWPSKVWDERVAVDAATDPDRPPFPRWWSVMAGQGQEATPAQMAAFTAAHRHITRFRGESDLPAEAATFARAATRDALYAAPQPVTDHWTRSTLSVLAGIAAWCLRTGQPTAREHVLSPAIRQRYLCGGAQVGSLTLRTYQSRLDVVAAALLAPPVTAVARLSGLGGDVVQPVSEQDEVDLWAWSRGLGFDKRRHRLQTVLALPLGVGARRQDMVRITADDVTRDSSGVHVRMTADDATRTVTCRAVWEDRLWDLAQQTPPGRLVVAPWRNDPLIIKSFNEIARRANRDDRPPRPFTVTSLRNTWIVRHLTAGTPLKVLLPAAALVSIETIANVIDHVPAPPADAVSDLLRQAR